MVSPESRRLPPIDGMVLAMFEDMVEVESSRPRVLAVDDDHLICWALEQEFVAHHMGISVCHDGKEALDIVRAGTYDLAIIDIHLPDANGISVLEEIKKLSPGTRAIVISADGDATNIRRAIAAGADRFIEKPFDPSTVRREVLAMFMDFPVPRRHPRYACRIPLRLSLLAPLPPGTGFDLENVNGIAENVGAGGVRVTTDFPLATGQIVRVRADAPDPADPLLQFIPHRGAAEVRWTTMTLGGFSAGLSFTKEPDRQVA